MPSPFIVWPGGKRRLAARIIGMLPDHRCYVEPFAGAAAVLFAKEPSAAEVLNDSMGELVNLYRVVQHHLDEFVRQFRWALASRKMFDWAQLQVPDTLTDIQRAARFFYLQQSSFGGKVVGRTFGTSATAPAKFNLLRIEETLSEAHLRLARVTIENRHWLECVECYDRDETVFFLDPPYWQTQGYGGAFGIEQYQALADALAHLKGKALLTINDHPDMRETFARFAFERVDVTYTIGGRGKAKKVGELIIRNW
jgi:DNA adenine methylase